MASTYIYGKVKKKQKLFKILDSETPVYLDDKIPTSGTEYDPNTLIENTEYYKINEFSTTEFATEFIKDEINSAAFDQITETDLKNLSYISIVQGSIYFFQVINTSLFIKKKWFAITAPSLKVEEPIVTINDVPDIVYDKINDILYFKKLSSANKIFKGMSILYKEATAVETEEFLESDFLDVDSDFNVNKVSVLNRRRIAYVKEVLRDFTAEQKIAVYNYTKDYGQVEFVDGKFKINTDDSLKFILWGIEQRYYTTPISREKRIANSVISIQQ